MLDRLYLIEKSFSVPDTGAVERRLHMKSRDFISVEPNHPQKRSRRNCLPFEVYDLVDIFFVEKIV